MKEARRHHFLPQVLLRGFQCPSLKGDAQTYLFRADLSTAKLVSVRDVAQQRDFHGRTTSSNLEEDMAKLESDYAPLLHMIREGSSQINAEDAACLVANISVRTKNLRDGFFDATGLLVNSMKSSVPLSKKFKRSVRNKTRKEIQTRLKDFHPELRRRANR